MLTTSEKAVCDKKIQLLDIFTGTVIVWCNGLSTKQKGYILSETLKKLCVALKVPIEEVINDDTARNKSV